MILVIRTDKSEAELHLASDLSSVAGTIFDTRLWEAGRSLSTQLLGAIDKLLADNNAAYADLTGIVVWQGPGSFTGLRIGITTANALAYSLDIPVVGTTDDGWIADGARALARLKGYVSAVTPAYGAEANITKPKK